MNYKLHHCCQIIGSTPTTSDHSVGFHDLKPFNKDDNNLVLLHRYPLNTLGFKANESHKADVCIWNFITSKIEKIDETDLWSWEQGSRLQWLNSTTLIYNKSNNQNESSIIYDYKQNKKKSLDSCMYSTNNNLILSINYSRLWKLWKSYGYKGLRLISKDNYQKKPDDDGIFLINTDNQKKLILSIDQAVRVCGLESLDKDFFLCHPTFNPSGEKFLSLLRYFNDSGALISYLISTDLKKVSHTVIAKENVSHFEWINDNKIIVWCRTLNEKIIKLRNNVFLEKNLFPFLRKLLHLSKAKFKNKILTNDYNIINLEKPSQPIKLNNENLNEDGHPQISPNKKFLITDTYADKKGFLKLLLLEFQTKQVYKIGEFKIADYLKKNNLKYDLHPRWDNTGNLINFDSSHLGSRQSYVLNIEKLLHNIS